MAAGRIELKIFLLAVAAVMTVEGAAFALATFAKMDRLMLVGVMRLLQTGLILGIVARMGGGWTGIGLGRPTLVRGIRDGLVWSVGFGCCALAVGLMLFWAGINPLKYISSEIPKPVREIMLLIVVGGVIGPVAEEVFFRGICYGFFRKWGIVAAIALTTAVFVLPHGVKTGIPIPQIVGGIVFAIAYEKGKSLLVPIVIHVSGNLALFAISIWM